ncbi:MAG: hypothetical protein PHZ09_09890 [Eubacteriales bacterium]|nr:hypothetical protein [Eubacteriales bacterium]
MKNYAKNRFKFIAWLLLIAMAIIPAASCSDAADDPEVTLSSEAAETTEAAPEHDLPDDLDFGGEEINIWYFTKNSDISESFIDIAGELDGDVVNEALYYRNLSVEESLNVDILFTDTGIASSDVGNAIRSLIMSGDDAYDVFNVVQWNSASLVTEGLYYNLLGLPYVDIEKPWWSAYYINELNIGHNNYYFLCGDISIDMIRCISCVYFNKNMFNNYYGDPDALYETVLSGNWTLERMFTYAEGVYADLNASDTPDDGDQFGLFVNRYNNIDILFYGAGLRATERDSDDIPFLTLNNEKTAKVMEDIYDLCYNNVGTMLRADAAGTLQNNQDFNNGLGLFLMGFLYTSEQLRNMVNDYGIIPSPKADDTQPEYEAVVHDIATLICLPATSTKFEQVGAVLELVAYESYKNVTPAYYETAMKTKYTRDQISSQIIDILHARNMTDIAYVFGSSFNSLGYIGRNMIAQKKSDVASFYATNEKAALSNMNKLVDAFRNLE